MSKEWLSCPLIHLYAYIHRWHFLRSSRFSHLKPVNASVDEEWGDLSNINLAALFCRICNSFISETLSLSPHVGCFVMGIRSDRSKSDRSTKKSDRSTIKSDRSTQKWLYKKLEPVYQTDSRSYKYIRKLMALPFLPEADITPMFQRLSDSATTASHQALVQYVRDNWVSSTMWPPSCWSVYMLPTRTNNDIEGWHHSLNRRANNRVHLPFYKFVS